MDDYPSDYVGHNLPLVCLSGLEPQGQTLQSPAPSDYPGLENNGIRIFSDFPPLVDTTAGNLLAKLLAEDATNAPWNARTSGKTGNVGFKVKQVGRTYVLPPRKAGPPTQFPPSGIDLHDAAASPLNLHSPISPLSPNSPTYPDGIATPLWVAKHQSLVPAAFVNFFPLTLDHTLASLRDNQLKIEINSLRKEWASSGYKTRLFFALICEDGLPLPSDINDRITSIRRATNLDLKNVIVLRPNPSPTNIQDLAKHLFSALQGPCVEYYRDLSKHSRRKKNRSSIPPPTSPPTTGTSQTLAAQGWNMRYEFKLGVFAEFRQEMDAACRSFENAYELLFGEEGFTTIAGWSSRFNDARLLADTLAIRIIRCLLWTEHTTLAVRAWVTHERRIRDIVDRRGKGTKNYGWEAWEARWSLIMAELMDRADLTVLRIPTNPEAAYPEYLQTPLYAPPDKSVSSSSKLSPWELLHHRGYWLSRAAQHTSRRRALAEQIPDEDRSAPDHGNSAQSKTQTHIYDTYLVPEPFKEFPLSDIPGTEYSKMIIAYLTASSEEFSQRSQTRMVEQQMLDIAREHMRLKEWQLALDILRPAWARLSWRRDGWWKLMERFGWALRECACQTGDRETILKVDWELMHHRFTTKREWNYDFKQSISNLTPIDSKPQVTIKEGDLVSCLSTSLIFEKMEGNVGEPLVSQLVIESNAQKGSAPISLTKVRITFEGCLRPITIQGDLGPSPSSPSAQVQTEISNVALIDSPLSDSASVKLPMASSSPLTGTADLTFAPGQIKAYNLSSIPREAGEVRIASISLAIENEDFELEYVASGPNVDESLWWKTSKKGVTARRIGKDRDISICNILPKPPKVLVKSPNLQNHYYTDEQVIIDILVENGEESATEISLEARLLGQPEEAAKIVWLDSSTSDGESDELSATTASDGPGPDPDLPGPIRRIDIGTLDSGAQKTFTLAFTNTSIPFDYELEICAHYHLISDVETPILQTKILDLPFIRPFEAHCELVPRLHPDLWPDFFNKDEPALDDETEVKANGLRQRWCLSCKMISFAHEGLLIEQIATAVTEVSGGLVTNVSSNLHPDETASTLTPDGIHESEFLLDVQRLALDDRQSATVLNLALDIQWRRAGLESTPSSTSTTRIPVPQFTIPMGEPRVLATATPSTSMPNLTYLDYTLENPSMHFLTFNVTMEASDQFAFSGPKSLALQLVPLSRHTVRYNILATGKDKWIQPQLLVVDFYYNKTLRVLPTEGMTTDKRGIMVHIG